jgi:YesN/AraC family two-component response regulator
LSEKSTSVQSAGDQFGAAHLPGPMREALSYIEAHLTQNITVREIAEAIHISPPYLSSVFRKHMGVPLVTYLQTRKIVLAKQMLEEGRSVTYACYESGFSDCSYFIRIFKRHLGMTPLQYRSSFRNSNK